MRKVKRIFLVLAAGLLLYGLHSLHLGLGHRLHVYAAALSERSIQKLRTLFDKTPPEPPSALIAGPTPTIKRVSSYYNSTSSTKHIMAPFDSTGSDFIVLFAGTHGGVSLALSDNLNNTWISLTGPTSFSPDSTSTGINLQAQIWYAKNLKTDPHHVLMMTLSEEQPLVLSVFVVEGSNVLDPIDAHSNVGNGADTQLPFPTSPSITTTHSNDLLIGFGKSWISEVWGAGKGFTLQPTASSDFLVAESSLATKTGRYKSSFVISSPSYWQAAVVAVRPAESLAHTGPITLTWKPSRDNVTVDAYQVERCIGVDCNTFAQIGTLKDTWFVDWTARTPAEYRYRVRAIDLAGNASDYSTISTVTLIESK